MNRAFQLEPQERTAARTSHGSSRATSGGWFQFRNPQVRGPLMLLAAMLVSGLALPSVGAPADASGGEPTPSRPASTNAPSKLRSSEDGWLDVSGFLDESYGFIPLVIPITEPAVGFGAAGGLTFIDKPQGEAQAGFGRPNLTAIGGMATENGTWGLMAGDVRHWLDDRLQTLVGVGYFSVNLDYYGIGEDNALQTRPLTYGLEPLAGLVQAKYRLGDSRWWGGLGYALATTQVRFDAPPGTPGLPSFQRDSNVGGVTPSLTYDSRDTMFTPTRGTYGELTTGIFSESLGGDDEFQRVNLMGMQYFPLHPRWTLGLRGDANLSFGDEPFYLRPFVHLRGTPAMRYQGEAVAQAEAELRWQFWQRFSVVGFVGAGAAWNDFARFEKSQQVITGGTGFRYELARKYKLHMGLDVAFGPDGPIFYIQFGSAWLRP